MNPFSEYIAIVKRYLIKFCLKQSVTLKNTVSEMYDDIQIYNFVDADGKMYQFTLSEIRFDIDKDVPPKRALQYFETDSIKNYMLYCESK